MNKFNGWSLIELLIVIAIVGIIAALGPLVLPRERFNVQQTSQGLARSVQLARLEAVKRNVFVGLKVDESSYTLFTDDNRNGVADAGETTFKTVTLDTLSLSAGAANTIVFDSRGVVFDPKPLEVKVSGASYSRAVCVAPQGLTEVGASCTNGRAAL